MTSIEETAEKLELMGIEACVALEHSIAKPGPGNKVATSTASLVFTGDASAQLRLAGADRSPGAMGTEWVDAARGFISRGVREHRLSRSMTKSGLLRPSLREIQILEWLETREEVFEQNPGYHGSRFGPEYAQAVASGRITYVPAEPAGSLRDLGVL